MTQQDTQPPAETLAEREIVARIIAPRVWDEMDAGQKTGTWWPLRNESLETADAILAALARRAGGDAIPAGMKPWHGGDAAPADWDRGRVLLRDGGYLTEEKNGCPFYWTHADDLDGFKEAGDIIAYTPKPPAGGDAGAVLSKRQVAYAYLKLRISEKRDIAKAIGLPLPDSYCGQLAQEKAFLRSVFDASRTMDLAAALAPPAPVVEGE